MNETEINLVNDSSMNLNYLNITLEIPINYAIVLYGYVTPVLFLITVTVNTLIVIVLSKRHMRTPTNLVLMSMALCDMCTLLFPFPWFVYMYTLGNHYKPLSSSITCYFWNIMNEAIPATFHTASVWLTLSLAIQRYIYVCYPILARTYCTVPRVTKTIFCICFVAVLHQSTRYLDKNYIEGDILWNNKTQTVCYVKHAQWVYLLTLNAYYTFYYSFRVLFVHLIPCASLIILNCMLFNAMQQAQQNRQKLRPCHVSDSTTTTTATTTQNQRKNRDANCTTLMLIVVVTVFLLVEIPLAVVTILHIISNTVTEILNYEIANKLILVTNFFIIASYPINFAIYCGMSKQFRQTFADIFMSNHAPRMDLNSYNNNDASKHYCGNGFKMKTNTTPL